MVSQEDHENSQSAQLSKAENLTTAAVPFRPVQNSSPLYSPHVSLHRLSTRPNFHKANSRFARNLQQRRLSSPGHYSPGTGGNSWLQSQIYGNSPQHSIHVRNPGCHRSSILVGQRSLELIEKFGKKEPTFVKFIIKLYSKWGFWIVRYAWPAIILCVVLSILGLIKILNTPQRNDLTGYSPFEARARTEYDKYTAFFSQHGLAISTYVYVAAKDDGSMLRLEQLNETVHILDLTLSNIPMYNTITHRNQSFNEFCLEFCIINEPVRQFYNAYLMQKENLEKGILPNPFLRLNYPISTLFGKDLSLQPYFFGVELYNGNETLKEKRGTMEELREFVGNNTEGLLMNNSRTEYSQIQLTNMKFVTMISLQFRAFHQPYWTDEDVKKWEMSVVQYYKNYESEYLTVYVISTTYVEEEMVRAGISLVPYLTVGFIIMCACSVISVMIRAAYMHQNNIFKALLAVMACTTPLLACCTALAILFLFGMRFSSILCIIPFLVLSIGVDSSYLMIHEWQRLTKEVRDGEKKAESVGHRMSEVLSEVGPAILISAITNILADSVGCFTSSPEIRLLCVGNLFSMFVAYLYQISFYSGLMSIVGKFEFAAEKNENNITNIAIQKDQVSIRKCSELTRKNSKFHDTSKLYISKYMKAYVDFITNPPVASFTILLYIVYVILCIWGITRININITFQKLFAADSPLIKLDQLRVQYQLPLFTMVSVFVENPGNLSKPTRLILMNEMVNDFENLRGSWGPVGTMYFVRDFVSFEKYLHTESTDYDYDLLEGTTTLSPTDALKFDNDDLQTFLMWPEYDFWSGFIRLQNNTLDGKKPKLKRFFFTTGYHDEQLGMWSVRKKLLKKWRAVVDKPEYKTFQASIFHEDGIFLDLIDNMPTDTWQSVAGTLVCMAAVCFLFLRSMLTTAIATTCVLSICIGILGILSWLSVDLDPISMAAMIISIGFSIDIPAHVSYHYYKACENGPHASPQARLANCLTSVAFPALQAASSTILCVCSLLFVRIYMSQVFVKTMITCVCLCNLHGLVVLPAVLSMVDRITALFNNHKTHCTPAEQILKRRMIQVRKEVSRMAEAQQKVNGTTKDTRKIDRPPIPEFDEPTDPS